MGWQLPAQLSQWVPETQLKPVPRCQAPSPRVHIFPHMLLAGDGMIVWLMASPLVVVGRRGTWSFQDGQEKTWRSGVGPWDDTNNVNYHMAPFHTAFSWTLVLTPTQGILLAVVLALYTHRGHIFTLFSLTCISCPFFFTVVGFEYHGHLVWWDLYFLLDFQYIKISKFDLIMLDWASPIIVLLNAFLLRYLWVCHDSIFYVALVIICMWWKYNPSSARSDSI